MANKRSGIAVVGYLTGLVVALMEAVLFPARARAHDGSVGPSSTGRAEIRVVVNRVLEPSFQRTGAGQSLCVRSNDSGAYYDLSVLSPAGPPRRLAPRLADTFRSSDCTSIIATLVPELRANERVVVISPAT
jgi:hypothetical protein